MKKGKQIERGGPVGADVKAAHIADFPKYRVTADGCAFNTETDLYLVPDIANSGYQRCKMVREDGKRVAMYIHRLVAMGFVANPLSLPEVHHIDHDKLNNHADNLLWVTASQNNIYTRDAGRHSLQVLTMPEAANIRSRYAAGEPQPQIAAEYGVSSANVSKVVRNQIWHDPLYAPPCQAHTISNADAMEIRLLFMRGAEIKEVARQYGISDSYVRAIRNGTRKRQKNSHG